MTSYVRRDLKRRDEVSEWISVKDRLPGPHDGPTFETFSPARGVLPAYKQYWGNNLWNYLWGKGVENGQWSDVTHWKNQGAPPQDAST